MEARQVADIAVGEAGRKLRKEHFFVNGARGSKANDGAGVGQDNVDDIAVLLLGGGPWEIRTPDLYNANVALYQLS